MSFCMMKGRALTVKSGHQWLLVGGVRAEFIDEGIDELIYHRGRLDGKKHRSANGSATGDEERPHTRIS